MLIITSNLFSFLTDVVRYTMKQTVQRSSSSDSNKYQIRMYLWLQTVIIHNVDMEMKTKGLIVEPANTIFILRTDGKALSNPLSGTEEGVIRGVKLVPS